MSFFITEDRDFPRRAERFCAAGAKRGEWYSFIKRFRVESLPEKAELFTLGADYFRVYLNGTLCGEYSVRSYIYRRAYEVYDVTDLLREGENELTVLSCETGDESNSGFCCELLLDGVSVGGEWLCRREEAIAAPMSYTLGGGEEIYDFRRKISEPVPVISVGAVSAPFTKIVRNKQPPQTRTPVFPVRTVREERVGKLSGYGFTLSLSGGCCAAASEFFSDTDTSASVIVTDGASALSLDGAPVPSDTEITIAVGKHTIAVASYYGADVSFFVKTPSLLDFSGWNGISVPRPKIPMRYPWNEPKKPFPVPDEIKKFMLSPDASSLCTSPVAVSPHPVRHELLTYAGSESGDTISRIYDFGREVVGLVAFSVRARAGSAITFFTFEMFDGDAVRDMGKNSVGKVIASDGACDFTSNRRRGFRYLCLRCPAHADVTDIRAIETRCPAEDAGKFFSDDERLNAVYKISVDTAKVCMMDSYVDCPGYEQNTWTGDAGITALVNMTSFGESAFDRRYLDMIGDSMRKEMGATYRRGNPRYAVDTYLPCACFPTYPEGTIPIWSFTWAMQVIDHYEYFGADDGFEKSRTDLTECLRRALTHINSRGLFEIDGAWNLIEWADNDLGPVGEVTANNMMLAGLLTRASALFSDLGETEKANIYASSAAALRKAIRAFCVSDDGTAFYDTVRDGRAYSHYVDFCKQKGREILTFSDYLALRRTSVQTATFAVLYDCADGDLLTSCADLVRDAARAGKYISGTPANVAPEKSPDTVGVGSPFFLYYLLKALFKLGEYDLAFDVIRREWGGMTDDGLTNCVETFKDKNGRWGRSAAHAWSASPAIFCKTELLGIKPLKPGYTEFTVVPHPSGVTSARGAVPTPYGKIEVQWHAENGDPVVSVSAPKECRWIKCP